MSCPMCDEWSSSLNIDPADRDVTTVPLNMFKQHLGSHQEQLALFSITPSLERDVDSEDASQHSGRSEHHRQDILLEWQNTVEVDAESLQHGHIDRLESFESPSVRAINAILERTVGTQTGRDLRNMAALHRTGQMSSSTFADSATQSLVSDYPELVDLVRTYILRDPSHNDGLAQDNNASHPDSTKSHEEAPKAIGSVDDLVNQTRFWYKSSYRDVSDLLLAAAIGDKSTVEAHLQAGVEMDLPWTLPRAQPQRSCRWCYEDSEYRSISDVLWRCTACRSFQVCHKCRIQGRACMEDPDHEFQPSLNARWGETALSLAARHQHWDVARTLLEHGAKVRGGIFGGTLLPNAITSNEHDIATFLVENGVDVNALDTVSGRRPLDLAALNGNLDIAEVLLDHGADVEVDGADTKHTLLRLAIDKRNTSMIQRLLARGATPGAAESTMVEHLMTPKETSADSNTDADVLNQTSNLQRMQSFNEKLDNALSDSEAALSELLIVEGANKICDTIFMDATSVAQLLRVLKVQDWTTLTQKDNALVTMEGIEASLIYYQSSIRALWELDSPSKIPLSARKPLEEGLYDRRLLEILDQIRRTRLAIENAADHLSIIGREKPSADGLASPTDEAGQPTSDSHRVSGGQDVNWSDHEDVPPEKSLLHHEYDEATRPVEETDPVPDISSATPDIHSLADPVVIQDSNHLQPSAIPTKEIVGRLPKQGNMPRGILRGPTEEFPEDPSSSRQGAQPLVPVTDVSADWRAHITRGFLLT